MDRQRMEALLRDLKAGKLTVAQAMQGLRDLPYQDLGFAKIDSHRDLRRGHPEVILCDGKTPAQVVEIARRMSASHDLVLATRAPKATYERIRKALEVVPAERLYINPDCGCLHLPRDVAYAKLCAMVEGTRIVRKQLAG